MAREPAMGVQEFRDEAKRPKRDAPCKCCLQCHLVVHNGQKFCPNCGYQFYEGRKPKPVSLALLDDMESSLAQGVSFGDFTKKAVSK